MLRIAPWARYASVASIGAVAYVAYWLPSSSDCLAETVMALLRGSDAGGEAGHAEHTIALVQNALSVFLLLVLPASFIEALATLAGGSRRSWASGDGRIIVACCVLLASSWVSGSYVSSDASAVIARWAVVVGLAWFAKHKIHARHERAVRGS